VLLDAVIMASDVHVVVNRLARRLREHDSSLLAALRHAAAGATLHETFSLGDLERVASEIGSTARTVVLAGGDGAYTSGVTAVARACASASAPLPSFAFAPGGTVSTTARNWGLRGPLADYGEALVRAIVEGRARQVSRPSLRITDDEGGDRVGFIWGAGLVARFFDAYYAQPQAGYVGAARLVARIFLGSPVGGALAKRVLTPVRCRVWVDGEEQSARGFSLMASSVVRDLGLHMHVLYRAGEDHERVHFVASPLGAPLLGPQMPLVLMGRRLRGRGHVDALAREVRVRFAERDAYVLDGEVIAAREVTISAGPRLTMLELPPSAST